jgi:hypothetical protein
VLAFRPASRKGVGLSVSSQAASLEPAGPPPVRRLYVRGTPPPFPRGRVFLARPNPAVLPPITPPVTRFVLRPVTRRTPFAPGAQWAASLPPTVPVVLPPRAFVVRGANRPGLGTGRVILNRRSSLSASIAPVTPPNPPRRPLLVPKAPLPPKVGRVFIGRARTRLPANPGPAQFFARAFFPATFFAPTYFPGGDPLVGGEWIPRALLVRPALPRPRTGSVFIGRSPRVASLPVFARPNRFQITSQAFAPRPVGRVFVGRGLAKFPPIPVDLLEAVIAWLNADTNVMAAVTAVAGDEAAVDTGFPYLVCIDVDGPTDYQSQTADGSIPYDDHASIQVTIVGVGKESVRSLTRVVDKSLNDAPLVFTAGTLNWFRRKTKPHDELDPDRGPNGADVWRRILIYDALIASTI